MRRNGPLLVVLTCVALLVFGLVQLFQLRFESGDAYPPYSSLRADPLGTMAFYESLARLPGLSVHRDHSVVNRLPAGRQTAYLHLAASREDWDKMPAEIFREVDHFVRDGGRLVITLSPETAVSFWNQSESEDVKKSEPAKPDKPADTDEEPESKETTPTPPAKKKKPFRIREDDTDWISIKARWGVAFAITNLVPEGNTFTPALVEKRSGLPLPETLEWHSGIVLSELTPEWQPIYVRGTNAVLAEREFGRGSVVIATDSYFLSNEAMREDRQTAVLAWLIGPSRTVFFDEAHLGVADASGVATLMRKYRLYWLVAAFVLLAGLFIWKNSFSLVPPHRDERPESELAGKDAAGGFINLLRRNIPRSILLSTCFAEWQKSVAPTGRYSAARRQHAEQIFAEEHSSKDPVAAYRAINAALETRKPKNPS